MKLKLNRLIHRNFPYHALVKLLRKLNNFWPQEKEYNVATAQLTLWLTSLFQIAISVWTHDLNSTLITLMDYSEFSISCSCIKYREKAKQCRKKCKKGEGNAETKSRNLLLRSFHICKSIDSNWFSIGFKLKVKLNDAIQ